MSDGRLSKAAIERLVAAGHARVGVCQRCWYAAYMATFRSADLHQADEYLRLMKEAEERAHRLVDSFHDRFLVLHLASFEIASHFLFELDLAIQPVKTHQPLHGQPLGGDVE